MRLACLFLAFASIAAADSITVTGGCSQDPCSNVITDQYGDVWGSATVGPGLIETTLGLTNAILYMHPDAVPSGYTWISFSETYDLPNPEATYDIFVQAQAESDECESCAPSLGVDLSDGTFIGEDTTEYVESGLSSFTISTDVSTIIQDSSDVVYFNVWYVDPPSGPGSDPLVPAPDPGTVWIAGLGLIALLLLRYRSACI